VSASDSSRRLAPQATLGLEGLPEVVAPEMLESDTFLRAFHHVLLEARACSHRAASTGCADSVHSGAH
jgi:hypothetical protein